MNPVEKEIRDNRVIDHIKSLVLSGFTATLECHELIFKDHASSKKQESYFLSYLADANTKITSAKTVYILEYELLGAREEFDTFFHKFTVFFNEVMTNASTGHSHQWSDIEFREFARAFRSLAGLMDIDSHFLLSKIDLD